MNPSLLYLFSSLIAAALVAINAAEGAIIMALLWGLVLGIDYRRFVRPDTRGEYSPFWCGAYAVLILINAISATSLLAEKGMWAATENTLCVGIAVLWLLQQRSLDRS